MAPEDPKVAPDPGDAPLQGEKSTVSSAAGESRAPLAPVRASVAGPPHPPATVDVEQMESDLDGALTRIREVKGRLDKVHQDVGRVLVLKKEDLSSNASKEMEASKATVAGILAQLPSVETAIKDAKELYKTALPKIASALVPALMQQARQGDRKNVRLTVVSILTGVLAGAVTELAFQDPPFAVLRGHGERPAPGATLPQPADAGRPSHPLTAWERYKEYRQSLRRPVVAQPRADEQTLVQWLNAAIEKKDVVPLKAQLGAKIGELEAQANKSIPGDDVTSLIQKLDFAESQARLVDKPLAEVKLWAAEEATKVREMEVADYLNYLAAVAAFESTDIATAKRLAESLHRSPVLFLPLIHPALQRSNVNAPPTVGAAASTLLKRCVRKELLEKCAVAVVNSANIVGRLSENDLLGMSTRVQQGLADYRTVALIRHPMNLDRTVVLYDQGCGDVAGEIRAKETLLGAGAETKGLAGLRSVFKPDGVAKLDANVHRVVVVLGAQARVAAFPRGLPAPVRPR
jgi:hypothetical protein